MNKNQELKSIITEFVPIRANYCVIPLASAILSAGYVKLSGRELPCKHLTFKTFNGKITELFIDGDEFVKLSDMNKKIEQALGYTLCMDCGETIKTTEQSKHLKECKRKDLEKIGE